MARRNAPLAPPIGRDAVDTGDAVARGSTHVSEVVVKEEHRAERHALPSSHRAQTPGQTATGRRASGCYAESGEEREQAGGERTAARGGRGRRAVRGGRRHRAPLDLLEVQRLGSVLDDDGVGANHFGGGAAARLDSQHLEPLPRPCRSVGTRGYGDRHIGIGESEQRTSAGRVKVEQLTARALDATETIIHWSEGRAATQPWPVPLQKHR